MNEAVTARPIKISERGWGGGSRRKVTLGRILFGIGCLAIWQWAHARLGTEWIAGPAEILGRAAELARTGELWVHVWVTFGEALLGFLIGGSAGVLLPFLLRLSPRLTRALDPYLAAAMGVPKLSLAPLLILWFGIGLMSKVVFVGALVFFLLFFNGLAGVQSVDSRLVSMARVAGGREWVITREIVWHTALPFIFAGLKVALPRAISAAVVGEFIAAEAGLGYYINNARSMADTVGIFTGVVLVTALVIVVNGALELVQARSLAWRPVDRDMVV
ncbi:MAG: ABC transporter permease [Deltaproteobacteria bacterium]|nr:ABC transporter permease [Deltaproteobacteria bacterium]